MQHGFATALGAYAVKPPDGSSEKDMKRGFSLVEVLIVVAVLIAVFALLLPVLSEAKDRAKHSESIAELRQLAVAASIYADDRIEVPPSAGVLIDAGLIPVAVANNSNDRSAKGIATEYRENRFPAASNRHRTSYISIRDAVGEPILRQVYEERMAGAFIDVTYTRPITPGSKPLAVEGAYYRVLADTAVVRRTVPWQLLPGKSTKERLVRSPWFFSDERKNDEDYY
ncbi:MAG: type II secretion system protein [Fimbriimonadaceae bacterium]|nr:type II secretion system protein [Fimbriimonadaceae bacterium]